MEIKKSFSISWRCRNEKTIGIDNWQYGNKLLDCHFGLPCAMWLMGWEWIYLGNVVDIKVLSGFFGGRFFGLIAQMTTICK